MFPRIISVALTLALLWLAHQTPALAHADLDRSIPADGDQLDVAPAQVEIWFTEELADGSTADVIGPDGERVDNGDAAIDLFDPERKHLVVTLQPGLQAGTYTVNWTSVSGEDDDTESGSFTFELTVTATPVASPMASPVASPDASPSPETAVAQIAGQAQPVDENAKPSGIAFAIGIGAGVLAALLIFGFWLLVRPRRNGDEDRTLS
jgi:methionine-rich copper-binding protein CopC